jgi:hypothetical protein
MSTPPITLDVDYPDHELNRTSTLLRPLFALPVLLVLCTFGGLLALPAAALIVARVKYPRWWFDFNRELMRFSTRVAAYVALMDDAYPSTDSEQHVHLAVEYPDVEQDLDRWAPLYKWLLAIPHYVVLAFLGIGAVFAVIGAWFAILATGRYPRGLFTYVEGVLRYATRVTAYVALLTTDEYPPFRLAS